jgi:hypothetical protein
MDDFGEVLRKFYIDNRDKDISNLHDPVNGTVVIINLPNGSQVTFGITNNDETSEPFRCASTPAKYPGIYEIPTIEQLTEPLENAPLDEWFIYYDKCKSVRKKINLSYIARRVGLSNSRIGHLHMEYERKKKK